jgi:hypothetical protein
MDTRTLATLLVGSALLFSAASPLGAGDDPKWRFGLRADFGMPMGSISDMINPGLGLSVFTERRLSDRHALSLALDYAGNGGKYFEKPANFGDGVTVKFRIGAAEAFALNMMLNHHFRFKSNDEGAYTILGAGVGVWLTFWDGLIGGLQNHGTDGDTKGGGGAVLCMGVGHNESRKLGYELRYFYLPFTRMDISAMRYMPPQAIPLYSATVQYLQFGMHYRF